MKLIAAMIKYLIDFFGIGRLRKMPVRDYKVFS